MILWLRRRLRQAARNARNARDGRDRGASAIEVAILGGTLVVVSMLVVQFALWFDARHAALAAAQEGDRAAREDFSLNQNWEQIAGKNAMDYFQSLNTGVLKHVSVQSRQMGNNTVSVTVSGTLEGVWTLTVSETVTGPVECFRTQVSLGEQCP